jgi:hypothetical protein
MINKYFYNFHIKNAFLAVCKSALVITRTLSRLFEVPAPALKNSSTPTLGRAATDRNFNRYKKLDISPIIKEISNIIQ